MTVSGSATTAATTSRSDWAWLACLAVLVITLDLVTKYVMFAWLKLHETYTVVPNLLHFTHNQLNRGAVFGMGNDHGDLSNYGFAAFSGLAILFILYWSRRPEVRRDRWLLISLGLILGGTAGNLYDRLVFGGVRDFIWVNRYFAWLDWRFNFAVFNLADSALVIGAGLLLLHTLMVKQPKQEAAPAPAA